MIWGFPHCTAFPKGLNLSIKAALEAILLQSNAVQVATAVSAATRI
jgi:hypothetical protein